MAKKKKIHIPKSVLDLRLSPTKFAKKKGIKLKGKGVSKRERKHNKKRLRIEYSECAVNGLNKAVKILAENASDSKKILKIKEGVDNIISNPEVMSRIAKIYKKHPENYPNMIYLPFMIMNTLVYYSREDISDDEKEIGKALDKDALISFCEKILKKPIKRYKSLGIGDSMAFQLATVIPTTKLFKNNRKWYKQLIQQLYDIAEHEEVDVDVTLKAISKIDKKKSISRKEFLEGFFSEFILQKKTNKTAKFNDTQKDLYEALIERALVYLNSLKGRKLKEVLKTYIKRRKTAESFNNDNPRVIKFIDYANSNSDYTNLKSAVQNLISDNSSNELYLC